MEGICNRSQGLGSKSLGFRGYPVHDIRGDHLHLLGFRCRVSGFQGFRVSRFQGFKVSRFQGFKVSKFRGFRVSGFRVSRVPGFRDFGVSGFRMYGMRFRGQSSGLGV